MDGCGGLSSLQTPQRDVTHERKQTRGTIHTWYTEHNAEVLLHHLAPALSSSPRHGNLLCTGGRFLLGNQEPAKFSSDYILEPPCHKSFLQHPWQGCSPANTLLSSLDNECSSWFGGSNSAVGRASPNSCLRACSSFGRPAPWP